MGIRVAGRDVDTNYRRTVKDVPANGWVKPYPTSELYELYNNYRIHAAVIARAHDIWECRVERIVRLFNTMNDAMLYAEAVCALEDPSEEGWDD